MKTIRILKYLLTYLFFLLPVQNSFSQNKIIVDSISIEMEKAKEPSGFSNVMLRSVRFDEKKLKFIMAKCQIKSIGKNRAEISAFSLLDTVNKVRYRVGDYLGYAGIIGSPEVNPYRKEKPLNGKKYPYYLPQYDSSVVDFFDQFSTGEYTDFGIPIEFGSENNPDKSLIYFGETNYKNFRAELFFITLKVLKKPVFELYYKNYKVGTFQIESN
ncbi:MAG: hypothetical protein PHC28_09660 [Flavobacterium sp.]|uniref:hypothetical protein n=1 Tax=Flavobacterium sp. TaxID=239 RepID=UPI00262B6E40|nr:hypothetical protein [Flavobacterium sp.]MDD5150721.1 hypothetical protein [Flavobacterium sp.]